MHEVDVFRQRLAQRARHRLDPPIGDEPLADLGLDHLLQDLQPALEVFAARRSSNAPSPICSSSCARAIILVTRPSASSWRKRAVEVVRAADRPARLHAREARHRGPRQHPHLVLVHAHQRVEKHPRELLVRHLTHGAALVHGGAQLVEIRLRFGIEIGLAVGVHAGREHREEHLEHGFEHAVVAGVLHERRTERGLERRHDRRAARTRSRASRRGSRSSTRAAPPCGARARSPATRRACAARPAGSSRHHSPSPSRRCDWRSRACPIAPAIS